MSNRTDNFNRADNATSLGTPSDGGSAWSALSGTWGISSNTAYLAVSAGQTVAVLDSTSSNLRAKATLAAYSSASGNAGIVVRASDNNNYFVAAISSTSTLTLFRKQAGAFTSIGGGSATWTAGDVIEYEVNSANEHRVYRNGSLIAGPFTDSFNATATKHGIRSHLDTVVRYDDFAITDLSAASILPLVLHHRKMMIGGY